MVSYCIVLYMDKTNMQWCTTFADRKLHLGLNSVLVSLKITLINLNFTMATLTID